MIDLCWLGPGHWRGVLTVLVRAEQQAHADNRRRSQLPSVAAEQWESAHVPMVKALAYLGLLLLVLGSLLQIAGSMVWAIRGGVQRAGNLTRSVPRHYPFGVRRDGAWRRSRCAARRTFGSDGALNRPGAQ